MVYNMCFVLAFLSHIHILHTHDSVITDTIADIYKYSYFFKKTTELEFLVIFLSTVCFMLVKLLHIEDNVFQKF